MVEELQVTGRPGHEQEQDPLGLRRELRRPRGHAVDGRGPGLARIGRVALLLQQMSQRHGAEPDAALVEEPAPGDLAGVGVSIEMVLAVHDAVFPPADDLGDFLGALPMTWARMVAAQSLSSGAKAVWVDDGNL